MRLASLVAALAMLSSAIVMAALSIPVSATRLHFPVSGMTISRTLFFIPVRIPPDSLGFLFFPEDFFHRNLLLIVGQELRITPESPEYSGIPVPAKQNHRDLTQDHGVGEALERRRPISWAVMSVRPPPSISP